MSVRADALRPPGVTAATGRPALTGAWLLSIAMVASGGLTYAFHVLAARTLGTDAYGRIAVLWGAMFLVAIVLFRPIEQTLSRTTADRLARGEDTRTVLRTVGLVALALFCLVVAALLLSFGTVADELFAGSRMLAAMLLVGVVGYGLAYFARGLLGGVRWFAGYGLGLILDAVGRLALAIPLLFVASQADAAVAVAGASLAGASVLLVGRRRLRPLLVRRPARPFHLRSALAFAAPAGVIAAADQVLVNAAPVLVILTTADDASSVAGVVFAATMLVRAPVYVFQGLAAALLPNFTHLRAVDDPAWFRRELARVVAFLAGSGALITVFAATVGSPLMRLLYGPEFEAGRGDLTLLGVGVGCYLVASGLTQASLARNWSGRAACVWVLGAVLFAGLYLVLPGSPLGRVSLAFVLAAAASAAALAALVLRHPGAEDAGARHADERG
jgi:O-antigen/teichoic acid export membrane protein